MVKRKFNEKEKKNKQHFFAKRDKQVSKDISINCLQKQKKIYQSFLQHVMHMKRENIKLR